MHYKKKLRLVLAGLMCFNMANVGYVFAEENADTEVISEEVEKVNEENIDSSQNENSDEDVSEETTVEESLESEIENPSLDIVEEDTSEENTQREEFVEEEVESQPVPDSSDESLDTPEESVPTNQMRAFNVTVAKSNVEYYATVNSNNEGIYTNPKGTKNALLVTSYLYNDKNVRVIEEATTNTGTYAKLVQVENGTEIGWINKNNLAIFETGTAPAQTNYHATIRNKNQGIYSLPKGMYNSLLYTTYLYNGKYVRVSEEITTSYGRYAKIHSSENDTFLGWIVVSDLQQYSYIQTSENVEMYGVVNSGNEGIYTSPKGTYGEVLITTYLYNGKTVKITEKATTQTGSFYKIISSDNNSVIGWINAKDISIKDFYQKRVPVGYFATVNVSNKGIYTEPKGAHHSILLTSYLYNKKAVKVIEEAETISGSYLKLATIDNGNVIGWIQRNDISKANYVTKTSPVNYYGVVQGKNSGIFTKPVGDIGSILVTSYLYNQKDVKVVEQVETLNGLSLKIADSSTGNIIGWIRPTDVKKNEAIQDVKILDLYGRVKPNNQGTYTKPKPLSGSILYTTYLYNNKDVHVVEQTTISKVDYVKLMDVSTNQTLGWIRKADISFHDTLGKTTPVNYDAKVLSKNGGIYTSPKGTYGSKLLTNYLYNNQKVKVTEEAVTTNGTFAKITQATTGLLIGWINKNDLLQNYIVFLDVGHGGSDSGAHYYGVSEKDINLQVANKMKTQLEAKGYSVIMSRTTDKFIDHSTERSKIANKSGADIFVSVHHNAMPGNSAVNGIETFYYEYDPKYPSKINQGMHNDPTRILKSAALANEIHNSLIDYTAAYDRGVRRDTFAVLRETSLPAVLLELGFMSNRPELNKLTSGSYQNVLAEAVAKGIDSYFKTR